MQYMGSKHQISRHVCGYLESVRAGRRFVDPFCGGLSITVAMTGERIASDVHPALIALYRAVQGGWEPPDVVTEETYNRLAATRDPNDPMTAFVGFGCSFGGKFFGGYARRDSNHWGVDTASGEPVYKWGWNALDIKRWVERSPKTREHLLAGDQRCAGREAPPHASYAGMAKRTLLEKMRACAGVEFACRDYRETKAADCLVYCDPAYSDTTHYSMAFDANAFWEWCRVMSHTNVVVVSEQMAPDDFVCVLEVPATGKLKGNGTRAKRVERLFVLR